MEEVDSPLKARGRVQHQHRTQGHTQQLPKGIYQYKFIVDGEWRFSPEDPTIPDPNGNINNVIDTTKFQPLVSIKK